jgi:thioredoxin reductase
VSEPARADPKSVSRRRLPVEERPDVLIVGADPAGLAAAIACARAGLAVVQVDENPVAFATMGDEMPLHYGQTMSGPARNRNAALEAFVASEPRIAEAFEAGVDPRPGVACWGLYANGAAMGWMPGLVAGLTDEGRAWLIQPRHVVLACGARDMGLAFPGWDKPGVVGATAAAALATRYGAFAPRRVVLLGATTPALAAARDLAAQGVAISAIVEQASAAPGDPALLAALRARGVEALTGHVLREAVGDAGVEAALVCALGAQGRPVGEERRIACDGVVLAVGATPVIDLLDAAGGAVAFQPERGGYAPLLDAGQRSTLPGVYAAGDCAGVWDSKTLDRRIAEAEGERAAAILGAVEAPAAAPPAPGYDLSAYRLDWARASIVHARAPLHVCQCEEVTARELLELRPPRYLGAGPPHPDQVKRLTRAGMGLCQGRRCREQVAALLALQSGEALAAIPLAGYRAPTRPLRLSQMAGLAEDPPLAEHWDTWFGMAAQWRPFWDVPAYYTVAGSDPAQPAASE